MTKTKACLNCVNFKEVNRPQGECVSSGAKVLSWNCCEGNFRRRPL